MLVIIPLLNANDPDVSLSLAVQLIHHLAQLNATDPTTYEVSYERISTVFPHLVCHFRADCSLL